MTCRRLLIMKVAVTLVALTFCNGAWAQGMSASVYSDYEPGAWDDQLWVDTWANAESFPGQECEHISYETTAGVISPSNRSYFNTYSQLGSAASLEFEEEEGDWEITSLLEFSCSCDGTVSVSDATMVPVTHHETYHYYPLHLPPVCLYLDRACTSGSAVCGTQIPFPVAQAYCHLYIETDFLRMWMGEYLGFQCSPFGVSTPSDGGGYCH